jgi:hypothetical protein
MRPSRRNTEDTLLISAAVPPVFPLGDLMQDAGRDARDGFSSPPRPS